jgi:hypothetical protein
MTDSDKLLLEIARCEHFTKCEGTSCQKIVNLQKDYNEDEKQLPEPWNGDIENCKILFISSNPSINPYEKYPSESWNDEEIIDFFRNRFSDKKEYVKNYRYPQLKEGYAKSWVRYWSFVRTIAKILLDNPNAVPGEDYALMEIVRCKSKAEEGVAEAKDVCAEKYLQKTIALSKAKVIVALGDKAKAILSAKLEIEFLPDSYCEKNIAGVDRMIFATPHSNARKKRTLPAILNDESIQKIKLTLFSD